MAQKRHKINPAMSGTDLLNRLVKRAGTRRALMNDPLQFPRRYNNRKDQEVVAFFSAILAWGKRSIIISKLEDLFGRMGPSPANFVFSYEAKRQNLGPLRDFKHRTFSDRDVAGLTLAVKGAYKIYGNLEGLFENCLEETGEYQDAWSDERISLKEPLSCFVSKLRNEAARSGYPLVQNLLPDPMAGSACKRLILFLRWVVRRGEFDLGLWTCIGPESLIVPLDLILGRAGRCLGFTKRAANDWKAAEEITDALRKYDHLDPVRFDFALSQIGCPPERGKVSCRNCVLM